MWYAGGVMVRNWLAEFEFQLKLLHSLLLKYSWGRYESIFSSPMSEIANEDWTL